MVKTHDRISLRLTAQENLLQTERETGEWIDRPGSQRLIIFSAGDQSVVARDQTECRRQRQVAEVLTSSERRQSHRSDAATAGQSWARNESARRQEWIIGEEFCRVSLIPLRTQVECRAYVDVERGLHGSSHDRNAIFKVSQDLRVSTGGGINPRQRCDVTARRTGERADAGEIRR